MDNLVTSPMRILSGKKEIVVGCKISQKEKEILDDICAKEDRTRSYVLRELAMRGLATYSIDGRLKANTVEEMQIARNTSPKAVPKQAPKVRSGGTVKLVPDLELKKTGTK